MKRRQFLTAAAAGIAASAIARICFVIITILSVAGDYLDSAIVDQLSLGVNTSPKFVYRPGRASSSRWIQCTERRV